MMKSRFGFLAVIATAIATAPFAFASQSGGGASGASEEMNLQADRIQIEDKNLRATFTGRVKAEQGSLTITSDRAVAKYSASILSGAVAPELTQVQATGNVVVRRPRETARSSYAVYDVSRGVITLIGDVVLTRGANVVRGPRLAINLDTDSATLGGGGSARTGSSSGGRVTGTFTVPKRKVTSENTLETPSQ